MNGEQKAGAIMVVAVCLMVVLVAAMWFGLRIYQARTVGDVEYVCTRKWHTEAVLNCTRTS